VTSESRFSRAIHDVTSEVQILVYHRESTPIKDRDEVLAELVKRLAELGKHGPNGNGKSKWRRSLLELAAYAVYAAVVDD